jgi:hypothetical protein
VAHGLAKLGRRERACGAAHVHCGGDLTDAREAARESTAGPHRRVDGGAAELMGVDSGARAARRGVDAGVGRHDGSAVTYEDDGGEG